MSEIAKRKNIYLVPSELSSSSSSKPARMSTPSSPNTTMSDDSIDFTVLERPDKPFKCTECSWTFKYNKHLLHHKRVKHGMDNMALYHQAKTEAQKNVDSV